MKVDFINSSYRRFYQSHKYEIDQAVLACIANGEFILREEVEQFEKTLAEYVGCKYAVGVNSGTDALFLSLKALGIKEGDEVITVSHTFIACLQVIVHCGATPILVDVTADGLMDIDQVEAAITSKTKAIIPVHLSGKVCDMTKLLSYNLPIVEDACQSLGATYEGEKAGSMGITGCFSFISPKSLGGISDGGAIVTDNKKIYEKLLLLRNHWNITQNALLGHQPKQPDSMEWGWNSRLGNVTAAFLNVKFKYYNDLLKRRAEIADMYWRQLNGLDIILPQTQVNQIYSEFIINVEDQQKFKTYMEENYIELLVRDTIPNHKLKGLGLEHFNLPVTEMMALHEVRLPIYPELTDEEVHRIIDVVRRYFR